MYIEVKKISLPFTWSYLGTKHDDSKLDIKLLDSTFWISVSQSLPVPSYIFPSDCVKTNDFSYMFITNCAVPMFSNDCTRAQWLYWS